MMVYFYELMTLARLRELRTEAADEVRMLGYTSLDLIAIERQIARKEPPRAIRPLPDDWGALRNQGRPEAIRPQSLARERYESAYAAKEKLR